MTRRTIPFFALLLCLGGCVNKKSPSLISVMKQKPPDKFEVVVIKTIVSYDAFMNATHPYGSMWFKPDEAQEGYGVYGVRNGKTEIRMYCIKSRLAKNISLVKYWVSQQDSLNLRKNDVYWEEK